jgi:hypothetical protein
MKLYSHPIISVLRFTADLILVIVALVLLFQMFYPYQPVAIYSFRAINPDKVVPGSIVWVELRWHKFMPIPAEVASWLVCGKRSIMIRNEKGNNPIGLDKITVSPNVIPSLTPKDWDDIKAEMGGEATCFIRGTYEYRVGFLQEVYVTRETERFIVW